MEPRDLEKPISAALVVAHPDDETLWAGGTILSQPQWHWYIATLCRASDPDRAPRFRDALRELSASGAMADLDDGPQQTPLPEASVRSTILDLLAGRSFDLLITHDPSGEYTRHLRHEETARAVIALWCSGQVEARELWTFAYEDGGRTYLPRAIPIAPIQAGLAPEIWQRKYRIITETYGFPPDGFEARTTPQTEAFWRFAEPREALAWLERRGVTP